jgi:hypothetical protein
MSFKIMGGNNNNNWKVKDMTETKNEA